MKRLLQCALLVSLVCGGLVTMCVASTAVLYLPGQSATLLPDGRLLLIGGEGLQGPVATAAILNPQSGVITTLQSGLHQARAWHTATLLPNGTVLVFGGIDVNGQLVEASEIFDPAIDTSLALQTAQLEPRAYHTATLLTDGRVLIAGGQSQSGQVLDSVALWDYRSNSATEQAAALIVARERHTATLLPDGSVLLWGGIDAAGVSVDFGESFDPVSERTSLQESPAAAAQPDLPLQLEASLPPDGASDVLTDAVVALRFSRPLSVVTANAETVTLAGPEGAVPAMVVPAESGRLVFVSPQSALLPATTYTVSMSGLAAGSSVMPDTIISFTTAGSPFAGAETGIGTVAFEDNSAVVTSAFGNLPALQAASGVTAVSGQVLRLSGLPLPNVTLTIAGQSTASDETGRFLLSPVPAGHQVMLIDGTTASTASATFGVFEAGIDVAGGKTNTLPYKIWMPALDTAHAVTIPSPTKTEVVITNPRLPGLELHLPPSTVVYDHNWNVVTQIGITPIPLDRPPFPLPNVNVPIYFTIQPGAGYIEVENPKEPQGGWLVYPNTYHSPPGTRYDFWNYDAAGKGWYIYGRGTVAPNGKQIVPDPGVLIYQLTGAMVASPSFAPSGGPTPGDPSSGDGDPVDLGTGLFVLNKTDLYLPDIIPITLTRTYRQKDSRSRAFGIGTTHFYDMFLIGDTLPWTYADLVLPDGGRIYYKRISPGTSFSDAVYLHTSSPTIFYGSTLSWNGNGWNLRLTNGTVLVFQDGFAATVPQQAALISIVDRSGNTLQLTRDSSYNLTAIASPNGRWVQLTYDSSNRVIGAQDNSGRTLTYAYDSGGRLAEVIDPAGNTTTYAYDKYNDMVSFTDARGIVYLQNTYDSNHRVISQTLASGGTYQFAYTLNSSGQVTQTQVTNPLGVVRNVTFNSAGYTTTDVRAVGRPEQETTTYQWQSGTNLLLGLTDALGRTTAFTYDTSGDVTQVTRLAGTSSPAVTSFTYDPEFHHITSITDPLNHTCTFTYDVAGNLVENVDALGNQWTATYNGAGQPLSITDPLNNTVNLTYSVGDLVDFTDPLGDTVTRIVNGAGLPVTLTDALGNSTVFSYDLLDQPTKIVNALGDTTQFSYDSDGDLVTTTDARNNVNTYAYDNLDRLISRTDPLSRMDSYQYDLFGNITQFTDRRGTTITFAYDGLNRIVSDAFASDGTTTSTIAFTYDAGNRLTQIVDSRSGTITRTYDGLNDLTSETTPQGSVTYTYDLSGRRTSMTVSGQSTVNYTFDNDNRLTNVTQGGATVAVAYDASGRRVSLTLPNGVVGSYTYDQASRLTALAYKNGSTTVGNFAYAYDADGRRISVGGTLANLTLPAAVSSATYDAANELTQWGAITLTYDANGNLAADGTNSYTWNDRNQLAQIADAGITSATFQYDSFDRRINSATGGPATSYLYDGINVVQQQSSTTANLLTGLAPDEIFSRTDTSGASNFLTDALGSTAALTDSSGTIQTAYSYAPFGDTSSSGAASTNPFQFTGREDDSTGLYYFRARYYSPVYSRFISEDPLRFFGGGAANLRFSEDPFANGYEYAFDSPTNLRDFSGLSPNPSVFTVLAAGLPIFGPSFPMTAENANLLQEAMTIDLSPGVSPLAYEVGLVPNGAPWLGDVGVGHYAFPETVTVVASGPAANPFTSTVASADPFAPTVVAEAAPALSWVGPALGIAATAASAAGAGYGFYQAYNAFNNGSGGGSCSSIPCP